MSVDLIQRYWHLDRKPLVQFDTNWNAFCIYRHKLEHVLHFSTQHCFYVKKMAHKSSLVMLNYTH